MISNCSHDENGKYKNGKAGDQTGGEWTIRSWYNRPWSCVARHPDPEVRSKIALNAEKAAKNNHIGYDQNQRLTYWHELSEAKYDASKITKDCEADCSAGVAANVKAAGYLLNRKELEDVPASCYSGNIVAYLKKAGFQILKDQKYRTSDKYLLRGDILIYEGHHVATNLTKGSLTEKTNPKKYSGGFPTKYPSMVKNGRKTFRLGDGYKQLTEFKSQIILVQKWLNWLLGSKTLVVDGCYGPKTAAAVVEAKKVIKYANTNNHFGKAVAKAAAKYIK